MPDDFMILDRGMFERTMKATTAYAKLLFQAMRLNADPVGIVKGSVEHWSSYLEYPPVPLEDIRKAIEQLESPDPESTSTEEEGRRIVKLAPNTWRIVNYDKYKYEIAQERRRAQNAAAQARYRAKTSGDVESPQEHRKTASKSKPADGFLATCSPYVQNAWSVWLEFRKLRRLPAYKSDKALRFLAEQPDPAACVEQSIRQEWTGLFPVKNSNGKMSLTDQVQKTKKELEKRFGD